MARVRSLVSARRLAVHEKLHSRSQQNHRPKDRQGGVRDPNRRCCDEPGQDQRGAQVSMTPDGPFHRLARAVLGVGQEQDSDQYEGPRPYQAQAGGARAEELSRSSGDQCQRNDRMLALLRIALDQQPVSDGVGRVDRQDQQQACHENENGPGG